MKAGDRGTRWRQPAGAAGPTGNRYGDEAGHSCIGVAGPVERAVTVATGDQDREANMWAFARAALRLLEECIGGQDRP